MENKEFKVYLGGGWFSPKQEKVLNMIERVLREHENIRPYFPRHDGVKLAPGEFHDPDMRQKVFEDNCLHIDSSDFMVAALDCEDGYLDTGTVWEVARAMARGIPVIAYDETSKLSNHFNSIIKGFEYIVDSEDSLKRVLDKVTTVDSIREDVPKNRSKVLFVSPDSTKEQEENNEKIASMLFENYGSRLRWVKSLSHPNIYARTEEVFQNVEYMVAVIDDRNPVVSWLMGQAYARNIPIISFTNYDYGVNLMLMCSIVSHVKGIDNLRAVIQQVKRTGIYSLGKFDNSKIKVY